MRIGYHTLGCKVNQYETEAIMEAFEKKGYQTVPFDEEADIYLVNTCTVTNVADKKSRQMLARAKRLNPNSVVVAMGCYAQIASEKMQDNEDIDLIIGSTKKGEVVNIVEEYLINHKKVNLVEDITSEQEYEQMWLSKVDDKKRAHIKIQDGCNQFCSYCIIPYTRGRVRSRKEEDILAEVTQIVTNGYKEIVLTGIHLASYGVEWSKDALIGLLEKLNEIEGLERIRLGSLEPTLITDSFVNRVKGLKKLCPHFHLSLQSGCDATLKRMNRKYSTNEYLEAVQKLRENFDRPAITTDLIVGFPKESEEEFSETIRFVEKVRFSDMHIFKYSKRNGTSAAKMDGQIDEKTKNDRSKQISIIKDQNRELYLKSFIGSRQPVLFEEMIDFQGELYHVGHTPNYLKVLVKNTSTNMDNLIVQVMLTDIYEDCLLGKID